MNGSPDIRNFELWLVDHHDGKLSEEETAMLRAFLLANPSLDAELDASLPVLPVISENLDPQSLYAVPFENEPGGVPDADLPCLMPEEIRFNESAAMLHALTFEEELAAYAEDALEGSARNAMKRRIIEDGQLAREVLVLKRMRLSPGTEIFPAREELLKKAKVLRLSPAWTFSAAAALVVAMLSVLLSGPDTVPLPYSLASGFSAAIDRSPEQMRAPATQPAKMAANATAPHNAPPVSTLPQLEDQLQRELKHETAAKHAEPDFFAEMGMTESPGDTSAFAEKGFAPAEIMIRYTDVHELPELVEVDTLLPAQGHQPSLWSKAVNLAQRLNRMGIRGINGAYGEGEVVTLSISHLEIERR